MKHLFIIDDDAVSVLILKKMLSNADFLETPMVFYNGNEALNFFSKNYTSVDTYCVFLDINMPVMNGWEFLDNIQTTIHPNNFMVYLLTSSTSEYEKSKSNDYQCIKKFISKPISKEILNEIKEVFNKS